MIFREFLSLKNHLSVLSEESSCLKSYKRTDAGESSYKCTVVASLFLELIF